MADPAPQSRRPDGRARPGLTRWSAGRALAVAACLGAASTPLLAACNQTTVRATRDPDADFHAYHTYAWADPRASGLAAIDQDRGLHNAIRSAVDAELGRLELAPLPDGSEATPDLVLTYHLAAEQRIESTAIENYTYSSRGRDRPVVIGQPFTQERKYVRGTLVLDMVDTAAGKVVWRGWAQADIDDYLDDPRQVETRVEQVIGRLLARFPSAPDEYDPDNPDPRF